MSGQKIYFQAQPKSVNNFLQNNNSSNLSTNTITMPTISDQPILFNDVNGDFGVTRNTLTNNYGLFLQEYLPGSTLSLNYGVIANAADIPYILTNNYSMIPTNKNSTIYNV